MDAESHPTYMWPATGEVLEVSESEIASKLVVSAMKMVPTMVAKASHLILLWGCNGMLWDKPKVTPAAMCGHGLIKHGRLMYGMILCVPTICYINP